METKIEELESKNSELAIKLSREFQRASQEYVQEKAREHFEQRDQMLAETRRLRREMEVLNDEKESMRMQLVSRQNRPSEENSLMVQIESLQKENMRLQGLSKPQEVISEAISSELGRDRKFWEQALENEVQLLRAQLAGYRTEALAMEDKLGLTGSSLVKLYKKKVKEQIVTIERLTQQMEVQRDRCFALETELAVHKVQKNENLDYEGVRMGQFPKQNTLFSSKVQTLEDKKMFWAHPAELVKVESNHFGPGQSLTPRVFNTMALNSGIHETRVVVPPFGTFSTPNMRMDISHDTYFGGQIRL